MVARAAASPASTQEVVFLDLDDDLGTVRAKLESTAADEIFLVIPRRSPILRTPLEFRILARLTNELSSETIIVTTDGARRALARAEGLRTKRSVRSLRHLSRPPGSRGLWLPSFPDWIPIPSFTGVVLTTLVAGLAAFILLVVVPVMRVTVHAQTIPKQQDIEVIVDPNARQLDLSRRTIAGETLQQRVEVVASQPTSGVKKLGRDKAKGEVAFVSQNPQAVTIPRGTVLVANNGAKFLTDLDVQVPPFSQGVARVAITAADPGPLGNVEARQIARIEGVDAPNITPRNDRPTQGGTDRDGKTVAPDDVAKLKEQLQNRAKDQALAELYARAGGDRSLIQPSLRMRTEGETIEPGVDAEAEQVTGRYTVVATATVFKNADYNALIQQTFLAQAGPGFDLPISLLGIGTPEVVSVDDGRVRLKSTSQATLVKHVDTEQVVEAIRWKTTAEGRAALARIDGLTGTPRIELTPEWAPRAYRVEVSVAAPR
ncbi:MAG: baseplate J/gp47 family protein [Chloroflexota bacterium]|nr:baseplate J/gp47 family protein [Chloroflexota bacterium]